MQMPSSNDEKALDALFRRARAEPRPADLHRVKQRLHSLAAQFESVPRPSSGGSLLPILLVVSAGILLAGSHEDQQLYASPSTSTTSNDARLPELPAIAKPAVPAAIEETHAGPIELADTPPDRERAGGRADTRSPTKARPKTPPAPETAAARVTPPPADPPPHAMGVQADADHGEIAPPTEPRAGHTDETVKDVRQEAEASFLKRAKVSLAADPGRALRMAEEHPSRYPHGGLIQEREVIAIEALIRLGRTEEARARAATFHSLYPQSAHRIHIDGMWNRVGGERVEGGSEGR